MNNLIPFQSRATGGSSRHSAAALLIDPEPHSHAVQFYETDGFLVRTVAQFLNAGLKAGDRLLVIATPEHRQALAVELDAEAATRAIATGQLTMLDARETLAKFMVNGMPDPDLFRDILWRVIAKTQEGHPRARLRAFGEMVDLLWREGNSRAAIRLEELWNEAGKAHSFSLLCAYVMGHFYKEGDSARFMEVCRTHSHVIPTEAFAEIDDGHARLREISLLQQRARALESEIQHRKELENALRDALRERSRVEEELRECVKREQLARLHAEASDAFKEMFLGILGHDLRNPLNTVLTTARLMKVRGDLPAGSATRLDRVVSSGVRMERMIAQLLDVARARLSDGISVTRTPGVDLLPLTAKIVDELQAAHPERKIDVRADGPCLSNVDADRIEQVVSNLIANALLYGDPRQAVTVAVACRGGVARLSVHNFGKPIEPAMMAMLFDPFKRGKEPSKNVSDGLGLGLYISERIVNAHGGKIEVDSTAERGTTFEVVIPSGAAGPVVSKARIGV
jgi:signal transduction histidine kinase